MASFQVTVPDVLIRGQNEPKERVIHQECSLAKIKSYFLAPPSPAQQLIQNTKQISPYQSLKAMPPVYEDGDVDILAPEFVRKYECQNNFSQPEQPQIQNGIVQQHDVQSLSYKYRRYQLQQQEDFQKEKFAWYLSPKNQASEKKKNCCQIF